MKTILNEIQERKQFIHATCNGRKSCGKCKIHVLENNVSVTQEEKNFLTKKEIDQGIRLACCHEATQDIHYTLVEEYMDILDDIYIKDIKNSHEEGQGLIVDIGTTTVVMKWISLENGQCLDTISFKNPQATYGGDVISRIQYDQEKPHILNQVIIRQIEEELLKHSHIHIKRMIICGNTVMTHLLLDSDVSSLGHVPFNIPIQTSVWLKSHQLFERISQDFDIYTFPHIAAFVGGDIVSGIMALSIDKEEQYHMFVDLGTNGELVVGNKEKILTTSTAAGPAFEGVGITCGGPSITGAITKVKIENDNVSFETIGHQKPICLCGSGLISLIAQLRKYEIIDEMGRFVDKRERFSITDDIYVTEKDIQIFQLAKAAIQAGIATLLREIKEIECIYISGGFASHIEISDLIELKLFPKQYENCIYNVKNSALSGAYALLLQQDYKRVENIVNISQNINLAEYDGFEDELIEGLFF